MNLNNLQHSHRSNGMKSPEYIAWTNMKERCNNQRHGSYKNYGGRGIKVCAEWLNDFLAFVTYVGPRPSSKHSLDRYPNPNGNYEPGNVRWATSKEQSNNRKSNRIVEFEGQRLSLAEWEREKGFPKSLIVGRLQKGWSIDRALTEPKRFRSTRGY